MKNQNHKAADGFSIIELLIVLIIISIMITITGYYLSNHQKLYKPGDQALRIADVLQEARQRALTQRRTMRVEIDLTDNIIRLINENGAAAADDDQIIRQLPLLSPSEVKIDQRPWNISVNPPELLDVPAVSFKPSTYPPSAPHQVCALRFQSNGTVVDAGNNATGGGAVSAGGTLYVWSPDKTNPNNSDIAYGITVIGTTGSIRMWQYDRNSTAANKWVDSRR